MTTLPLRRTWTLVGTCSSESWRDGGGAAAAVARACSAFSLASLSASSREMRMSRSVPPGVFAVLDEDVDVDEDLVVVVEEAEEEEACSALRVEERDDGVCCAGDACGRTAGVSAAGAGGASPRLSALRCAKSSFLLSSGIRGWFGATRPCLPGDQSSSTCMMSCARRASARRISSSTRSNVESLMLLNMFCFSSLLQSDLFTVLV